MWGNVSVELETEGGFWLVLAMMGLLFPFQVTAGILMAAAVHELGHILTIRLTGGKIRRLVLHAAGARLETDPMEPGQELLCALAGPAAGALTVLAWRWFPELALAGLVQTIFNLLPVYPLDGGRAWHAAGMLIGTVLRNKGIGGGSNRNKDFKKRLQIIHKTGKIKSGLKNTKKKGMYIC